MAVRLDSNDELPPPIVVKIAPHTHSRTSRRYSYVRQNVDLYGGSVIRVVKQTQNAGEPWLPINPYSSRSRLQQPLDSDFLAHHQAHHHAHVVPPAHHPQPHSESRPPTPRPLCNSIEPGYSSPSQIQYYRMGRSRFNSQHEERESRSDHLDSRASISSWSSSVYQGSRSSGDLPLPATSAIPPKQSPKLRLHISSIIDLTLGQLYFVILLRMPSHYFNRITRVFLEAELSVPDVKDMSNAIEDVALNAWYVYPEGGGLAPPVSPALSKFRILWKDFILSMKSDWKSANIVSVLLLGALLTMLQIGGIEGDPVARTSVLLSLVCALMSLLYGSIYMARFGMMNRLYKAAAWAAEARRVRTPVWWNVWIFLALPTIWLAWSVIFFAVSILLYVWRTGSVRDPQDPIRLAPLHELGPRISISVLFVLGLLYLVLVLGVLRRFGSSMDDEWRVKTHAWRTQKTYERPGTETMHVVDTPPRHPLDLPIVATASAEPPLPSTIPEPVSERSSTPRDQSSVIPGSYRPAVQDPARETDTNFSPDIDATWGELPFAQG